MYYQIYQSGLFTPHVLTFIAVFLITLKIRFRQWSFLSSHVASQVFDKLRYGNPACFMKHLCLLPRYVFDEYLARRGTGALNVRDYIPLKLRNRQLGQCIV